ncbi:MAG: PD-(D/E)XK motif protein [Bacteroidetes bacterium]|nr:PD-(D/E)XK motif protein [Bacteroidota bacterium]
MKLDKTQIGLAGEYYVLAQLTARGFIATLTLGNTKGIDILVTNQEINSLFKVEVKTTTSKPGVSKIHSTEKCYQWTLSSKHENLIDENLIYCFVYIQETNQLPLFFLVPSKEVANYVKWQHKHWLELKKGKDTTMRKFRIELSDPKVYRNNWDIFHKK